MAVADFDFWMQAQNCLLGTALIDADFIPRLVSELHPEDFSGRYRLAYEAIATLFRSSARNEEVDPVAILHALGNTPENRQLLADLMGSAAYGDAIERYLDIVRSASRLSRMRDLGDQLKCSVSLDDAMQTADKITNQLLVRPDLQGFDPAELDAMYEDAGNQLTDTLPFPIRGIQEALDVARGDMCLIGAEPSGGKTLFALQLLVEVSKKYRTLFVSLETKPLKLYNRLLATSAKVPLKQLKRNELTVAERARVAEARHALRKHTFRIVPSQVNTIASIKAAAVSYRAEVVIIDYLQLIQIPGPGSRYEKVTEISMGLHMMAQTTGMIVIPLSQVTNRSPEQKNKPLDMHSGRESGQIEADCDSMLMIDKYIEKGLTESGCKADRILRCVKNKEGSLFRIPLKLDGATQAFTRAYVPNPEWEKTAATKQQKGKKTEIVDSESYGQLSMNTAVPFEKQTGGLTNEDNSNS